MLIRITAPPGFNLYGPAINEKLRRAGVLEQAKLEGNEITVEVTESQLSQLRSFAPEFQITELADTAPAAASAASQPVAAVATASAASSEPEPMTVERAEMRLAELRHQYSLKDEEVLAAAEAGQLPPNKDFEEWLSLIQYLGAKGLENPPADPSSDPPPTAA